MRVSGHDWLKDAGRTDKWPDKTVWLENNDRTYVVVIALFLLVLALNEIHCPRMSYPSIMYS